MRRCRDQTQWSPVDESEGEAVSSPTIPITAVHLFDVPRSHCRSSASSSNVYRSQGYEVITDGRGHVHLTIEYSGRVLRRLCRSDLPLVHQETRPFASRAFLMASANSDAFNRSVFVIIAPLHRESLLHPNQPVADEATDGGSRRSGYADPITPFECPEIAWEAHHAGHPQVVGWQASTAVSFIISLIQFVSMTPHPLTIHRSTCRFSRRSLHKSHCPARAVQFDRTDTGRFCSIITQPDSPCRCPFVSLNLSRGCNTLMSQSPITIRTICSGVCLCVSRTIVLSLG